VIVLLGSDCCKPVTASPFIAVVRTLPLRSAQWVVSPERARRFRKNRRCKSSSVRLASDFFSLAGGQTRLWDTAFFFGPIQLYMVLEGIDGRRILQSDTSQAMLTAPAPPRAHPSSLQCSTPSHKQQAVPRRHRHNGLRQQRGVRHVQRITLVT
jgi:hypothetical protein